MAKIITHAELDEKLTKIASEPEAFARKCQRLIRDLDARGVDLEISDPIVWRSLTGQLDPTTRVPLSQQFRSDVDGISIQGREDEARLARMNNLDKEIERRVQPRADQLEVRAESLCRRMETLDRKSVV